MDDEELSCEGLQSILIDWQGGFVGSVANDLMWAIYPFLEANSGKQVSFFYFLKKLKTFDQSSFNFSHEFYTYLYISRFKYTQQLWNTIMSKFLSYWILSIVLWRI